MSPRITFLLTLAGAILLGLPLLVLTQTSAPVEEQQSLEDAVRQNVYANLRYTGQPTTLRLRQAKGEWIDLSASGTDADFELELPLSGMIEIELQAEWTTAAAQAITLTLEPDGHESKQDTQWKDEGSHKLHTIFRYSW